MTRSETDEFLAGELLAHFATVDGRGHPRVRPLWYLWRDHAFWFTTRLEHRHTGRDLTSGPVAFSIASNDRPYRAVIVHGQAEVVGKDEGLLMAISSRYGEAGARRWLPGALKEADRVVFKVSPESMLAWNYGRGDSTHKQDQGVSMRVDPGR